MNLKPSITVGVDAAGKYTVLYVGPDAGAARAAMEKLPEGIVIAEAYRRPHPWKRRKARAAVETPVPEVPEKVDEIEAAAAGVEAPEPAPAVEEAPKDEAPAKKATKKKK